MALVRWQLDPLTLQVADDAAIVSLGYPRACDNPKQEAPRSLQLICKIHGKLTWVLFQRCLFLPVVRSLGSAGAASQAFNSSGRDEGPIRLSIVAVANDDAQIAAVGIVVIDLAAALLLVVGLELLCQQVAEAICIQCIAAGVFWFKLDSSVLCLLEKPTRWPTVMAGEEQQTAAAADIERIDLTRQAMAAVALAPPIAVTSVSGAQGAPSGSSASFDPHTSRASWAMDQSSTAPPALDAAELRAVCQTCTVKELKKLLTNLAVDLSGYVEKSELVDAAVRRLDSDGKAKLRLFSYCRICCNWCLDDDVWPLTCGHLACFQCLGMYLESQIQAMKSSLKYNLPCIYAPACSHEMRFQDAASMSAALRNLWKDLQQRERLIRDAKYEVLECPQPGCVGVAYKERGRRTAMCFMCEHTWEANSNGTDDDGQKPNFDGTRVRKCPKCQAPIEKNGGCNHMHCTRCGRHFDWTASQSAGDPNAAPAEAPFGNLNANNLFGDAAAAFEQFFPNMHHAGAHAAHRATHQAAHAQAQQRAREASQAGTGAAGAAEPADLFNHFGNLLGANAPGFQHVMGNVAQAAGGFMQQMQHAAQMRQAHEAHEAAQQAAAEQAHRVHQAAHQASGNSTAPFGAGFAPTHTSSGGTGQPECVLSLLEEQENQLRCAALQRLNEVVDQFWHEIADYLNDIETLYEDPAFPGREMAALVASKVFYHLEEYRPRYDDALRLALGAGQLFNLNQRSEYVEKIVAVAIDEYVKLTGDNFELEMKKKDPVPIDARLEDVVNRMFARCMEDKAYKHGLGMALETRRLDKEEEGEEEEGEVTEFIKQSDALAEMLEYAQLSAMTLLTSKAFRERVLKALVEIHTSVQACWRDIGLRKQFLYNLEVNLAALAQCYFILGVTKTLRSFARNPNTWLITTMTMTDDDTTTTSDAVGVAKILKDLLGRSEKVDNESQHFCNAVLSSPLLKLKELSAGSRALHYSTEEIQALRPIAVDEGPVMSDQAS
ncbi:26S proteasome non-ATPase regulatory subunit 1 [Symbiodinium microadriaticum]|uniref:26S proteasome non-ATPase regulatory subunit 1 n=1 Tax=Symbiodinium microadriaticum TaxID=2951 RepID=A0A1Q9E1Y7_SYMMI|nr:26S proteasome non-ATPase regulatory subunit 1 [Symbiodinium microadriaticum]